MGKSSVSHDKKTDKETQSPLLRIFKEIMQKEHNDLEKSTLVREKRKKKRKQYSSLSKSEQKYADSSGVEKDSGRRNAQYNVAEKSRGHSAHRTQSNHFPSEKRESWWLWGDSNNCAKKPPPCSTCSCVSCKLKKILNSEYTCMSCIVVLLIISIIAALTLLCNTIVLQPEPQSKSDISTDSLSMSNKLNKLQGAKEISFNKKHDFARDTRRSVWNEELKNLDSSLAEHDLSDTSLSGSESLRSGEHLSADLSSVLDPSKFSDAQVSPRLRMFYKKLVQTDAQIKNLKKGIYDSPTVTVVQDKNNPYRLKRSLFHRHKAKTSKKPKKGNTTEKPKSTVTTTATTLDVKKNAEIEKSIFTTIKEKEDTKQTTKTVKTTHQTTQKKQHGILTGIMNMKDKVNKKKKPEKPRDKRFENLTEPTGIVFEKKQLVVKYLDNKPKFPKCSHAVKEPGAYEHEQNPKNPEQIDELLDQFLDRNLHDVVQEDFGIDNILEKTTTPLEMTPSSISTYALHLSSTKNHPRNVPTTSNTISNTTERLYNKYFRPNMARAKKFRTDLAKFLKADNPKRGFEYPTPPAYDVVLSITTLMNPALYNKRATKYDSDELLSKLPVRKLMQSDDDDTLMANHDDIDKRHRHMEKEKGEEMEAVLSKLPVRRLMQSDDDDVEAVGNEDLKEMLSDDMAMDTYDEMDTQERRKRHEKVLQDVPSTPIQYKSSGVVNPNWKGPLPLYPDELNAMIKQIDHAKSDYDITETTQPYRDVKTTNTNDIDYIQDYFNIKYESLAKMAQAYSDYGVLDEKKDNVKTNDNNRRTKYTEEPAVTRQARRGVFDYITKNIREGISIQAMPEDQAIPKDNENDLLTSEIIYDDYTKFANTDKFKDQTVTPRSDRKIFFHPLKKFGKGKTKKKLANSNRIAKYLQPNDVKNYEDISIEDIDKLLNVTSDHSSTPNNENTKESPPGIEVITERAISYNNDTKLIMRLRKRRKRSVNFDFDKDGVMSSDRYEVTGAGVNNESGFRSVNDVKAAIEEFHNNTGEGSAKKRNGTEGEMGAGEFFALLSDWFRTLAGVSEEVHKENRTTIDATKEVLKLIPITSTQKPENKTSTKDIVYPMYDSDMIDNIGHRSRVLLSIEDDHANDSDKNEGDTVSETTNTVLITTGAQTTTNLPVITNDENIKEHTRSNAADKANENKTLVKRSAADDSNLVFWNDIYDDEYGIKIDPLDDPLGNKRSANSDVVKKSAGWIQDKVKKMSDSIKKKSKQSFNNLYKNNKKKTSSGSDFEDDLYSKENLDNILHKISKRSNEDGDDKKATFAVLTAHMQEVCKQASQAVQQTRNIRQNDNHQSVLASGMMQQLVRLMSELVDFEVQQKTCLKVPDDLKEFLDWLTSSVPDSYPKTKTQRLKILAEDDMADRYLDLATAQSSEKEDGGTDVRSECLGTLQAIQSLMQEYAQLSDEDKKKMGGVKEYLEDQLDYLNKQLSSIDEMNLANIYAKGVMPYRYRRDMVYDKWRNHFANPRRRFRRRLRKFSKNYGKKRTRSTINHFESIQISTESYGKDIEYTKRNIKDKIDETKEDIDKRDANLDVELISEDKMKTEDKQKKNLQDVYYRAVADARKMTTEKDFRKNFVDGLNQATVVSAES